MFVYNDFFFVQFIDRSIFEHRQSKCDCIQSRLLLCQIEMTWNKRSFELFDSNHEYLSSRVFFFRLVFFYDDFLNHKNWIFKKNESQKSFHFFLLVKFVENFVYEFLIFDFHWINAVSFVIVRSIRFERYRHMCWFKHFYCRNFFFHKCFHRCIIFSIFFLFFDSSYIMMSLIKTVFKLKSRDLNLILILWSSRFK